MDVRRMRIAAHCPACGLQTLDYSAADLDVPHFPNSLQLIFECASCGFRHTDFMVGATREPTRHIYQVSSADDMMVRVVRSTSGTIRIPELGILIEPGPASDAYVSNIEGVLVRVEAVLNQLRHDAETPEEQSACDQRLADLRRAREGQYPFTFILEDPFGNSLVVHDRTRAEPISAEEAAQLKTGTYTLEMQESVPGPPGGNGHGNGGLARP
jgi:zinc finger protein